MAEPKVPTIVIPRGPRYTDLPPFDDGTPRCEDCLGPLKPGAHPEGECG